MSNTRVFKEKRNYMIIIFVIVVVSSLLLSEYFNVTQLSSNFMQFIPNEIVFWSIDDNEMDGNDTTWPSLKHTSMTVEELEFKYNRCISQIKYSPKQCATFKDYTSQAWRSYRNVNMTRQDDYKKLTQSSLCCAVYNMELIQPSPRQELFPWEHDYLQAPLINNLADLSWANNSYIQLITPAGENNTFQLGSQVKFTIEMYNGHRKRRSIGGDLIYVWLVSHDLNASIAADVTDFNNGTYTAVTVLPWSGIVTVKAALVHHRERFRTVFYIHRVFKSTRWLTGNFVSNLLNVSEATPCSPFPYIPGHSQSDICNLTQLNDFPWYCGKPVKREFLNCMHFSSVSRVAEVYNVPLSDTESWLFPTVLKNVPYSIPHNISLNVIKDKISNNHTIPSPQLKCHKRNLSYTFDDNNSYGFFYLGNWRTLACQSEEITKEYLTSCLKKTQLIYIGDSNGRAQYDVLCSLVPCQQKIRRSGLIWHAPLRCENESNNMTIKYFPHNFPFFGYTGEESTNKALYSEVRLLDVIPNEGKYIIVLHHFMHIAPYHLSVLETRLKIVRAAIERLLKKNPHVIILYQSAHSVHAIQTVTGAFIVQLQRTILKGLGERVMFVYTWPMSIAVENNQVHPQISKQFAQYYMGHICGRL